MPSSAVARRLRREQNRTSTLMLAARDAIPDIVTGLDLTEGRRLLSDSEMLADVGG